MEDRHNTTGEMRPLTPTDSSGEGSNTSSPPPSTEEISSPSERARLPAQASDKRPSPTTGMAVFGINASGEWHGKRMSPTQLPTPTHSEFGSSSASEAEDAGAETSSGEDMDAGCGEDELDLSTPSPHIQEQAQREILEDSGREGEEGVKPEYERRTGEYVPGIGTVSFDRVAGLVLTDGEIADPDAYEWVNGRVYWYPDYPFGVVGVQDGDGEEGIFYNDAGEEDNELYDHGEEDEETYPLQAQTSSIASPGDESPLIDYSEEDEEWYRLEAQTNSIASSGAPIEYSPSSQPIDFVGRTREGLHLGNDGGDHHSESETQSASSNSQPKSQPKPKSAQTLDHNPLESTEDRQYILIRFSGGVRSIDVSTDTAFGRWLQGIAEKLWADSGSETTGATGSRRLFSIDTNVNKGIAQPNHFIYILDIQPVNRSGPIDPKDPNDSIFNYFQTPFGYVHCKPRLAYVVQCGEEDIYVVFCYCHRGRDIRELAQEIQDNRAPLMHIDDFKKQFPHIDPDASNRLLAEGGKIKPNCYIARSITKLDLRTAMSATRGVLTAASRKVLRNDLTQSFEWLMDTFETEAAKFTDPESTVSGTPSRGSGARRRPTNPQSPGNHNPIHLPFGNTNAPQSVAGNKRHRGDSNGEGSRKRGKSDGAGSFPNAHRMPATPSHQQPSCPMGMQTHGVRSNTSDLTGDTKNMDLASSPGRGRGRGRGHGGGHGGSRGRGGGRGRGGPRGGVKWTH